MAVVGGPLDFENVATLPLLPYEEPPLYRKLPLITLAQGAAELTWEAFWNMEVQLNVGAALGLENATRWCDRLKQMVDQRTEWLQGALHIT